MILKPKDRKDLRELLSENVPKDFLEAILDQAGLKAAQINLNGSYETQWGEVLKHAERHGKADLGRLLNEALDYAPDPTIYRKVADVAGRQRIPLRRRIPNANSKDGSPHLALSPRKSGEASPEPVTLAFTTGTDLWSDGAGTSYLPSPFRTTLLETLSTRPPSAFLEGRHLEAFFVAPNLYQQMEATATLRHRKRPSSEAGLSESNVEKGRRSRDIAWVAEQPRLVILGAPGSGKSILCHWLALRLARHPGRPLPILVRVKEMRPEDWDRLESVTDCIARHVQRSMRCSESELEEVRIALQARNAAVILDGLDEAGPDIQAIMPTLLNALFHRPPGAVWATARSTGFNYQAELHDAPILTLAGLQMQGRNKLLRTLLDSEAPAFQRALGQQLASDSPLDNPLLLTVLATRYRDGQRTFPTNRAAILRYALETLVERWPQKDRKISPSIVREDPDRRRSWLRRLAYTAHLNQEESISVREAARAWHSMGGCGAIETMLQSTALLDAAGEDRYTFVHRALRELLVAEYLLSCGIDEMEQIVRHPWTPRWENVFLLAAGITVDDEVCSEFTMNSVQLMDSVMKRPDTPVHHRLFLSGRMLREMGDQEDLTPALRLKRIAIDEALCELISDPTNWQAYGTKASQAGGSHVAGMFEACLSTAQPYSVAIFYLKDCAKISSSALSTIERCLHDEDPNTGYWALTFFTARLDPPTSVRAAALTLLNDPDAEIREAALDFLAGVELTPDSLLRVTCMFEDTSENVRFAASLVLEQAPSLPVPVLQLFLEYLRRDNDNLHECVYDVLVEHMPLDTELLMHLALTLKECSSKARLEILDILMEHELTGPILEATLSALVVGDVPLSSDAFEFLEEKQPSNLELTRKLVYLLVQSDTHPTAKKQIAGVLARDKRLPEPAQEYLINLLTSGIKDNTMFAQEILAAQTHMAEAGVGQLLDMMDSPVAHVRQSAVLAVRNLNPMPPRVLSRVNQLLQDGDPQVVLTTLLFMYRNGGLSDLLIRETLQFLQHALVGTRMLAAFVLGTQPVLPMHAIEALESHLDDDERVQIAALSALAKQRMLAPGLLKRIESLALSGTTRLQAAAFYFLAYRETPPAWLQNRIYRLNFMSDSEIHAGVAFILPRLQMPDALLLEFMPLGKGTTANTRVTSLNYLSRRQQLPDNVLWKAAVLLGENDDSVSEAAERLLIQRSWNLDVFKGVAECIRSGRESTRECAIRLIRSRETLDEVQLQHLTIPLRNSVPHHRSAALRALNGRASLPPPIVERIFSALGDPDYDVRTAATDFAWERYGLSETQESRLLEMLKSDESGDRFIAVTILDKLAMIRGRA